MCSVGSDSWLVSLTYLLVSGIPLSQISLEGNIAAHRVGDLRNRIKEIKVQLAAASVEATAINAQQELLEQVRVWASLYGQSTSHYHPLIRSYAVPCLSLGQPSATPPPTPPLLVP